MKVKKINKGFKPVRLELETEQEFEVVLAALETYATGGMGTNRQIANDIADALAEKGDLR